MSIQHVIWDWNGTLLDDREASLTALNLMLASRGMPLVDRAQYQAVFGFPVRDCYRALGFDVSDASWDSITLEFHDHYGVAAANTPLRDRAADVLQNLQQQGLAFSVLSASEQSLLDTMIGEREIAHFFEHVCGISDLYGGSKMDVAYHLLQDLAIPAANILLVGDTIHDYEVASALGCPSVLLTGGHQNRARLQECGCPILSGLPEVQSFIRIGTSCSEN